MKALKKVLIVIDIVVVIVLILLYTPLFSSFKMKIIETTLSLREHEYLPYVIYDQEKVDSVYKNEYDTSIDSKLNIEDIYSDTETFADIYDNKYDEDVLIRDYGNEEYKYLKIKVGKYDAHLVAIYHPEKIKLLNSPKFNTKNKSGYEKLTKMAKRHGAIVAINGGGFVDYGSGSDIPRGYVIKDGKIIWKENNYKKNIIGFDKDNNLKLIYGNADDALNMGIRDGLTFSPFLIIDGVVQKLPSSAGGFKYAARSAIGQRKDGIVLFLVTEGYHGNGPTIQNVQDTLIKYGAYNAANLDGGGSVSLVINGKLINNPLNTAGYKVNGGLGRNIVTAFGLVL